MNRCTGCGLELSIGRSFTAVEDGRAVAIQELVCRNPRCPFGRHKIPVKRVKHYYPVTAPEEQRGVKSHCGAITAVVGDKSYFVAPGVEYAVEGDTLRVKCHECGEVESYDIGGRTREEM